MFENELYEYFTYKLTLNDLHNLTDKSTRINICIRYFNKVSPLIGHMIR